MESNIYIKALELGLKHPNGIKYAKLIEGIADVINENLNNQAEYNFIEWLVENFQNSLLASRTNINRFLGDARAVLSEHSVDQSYHNRFNKISENPWILKGNAIKQYLDYLELKESREQALRANKRASLSITIAVATLAFSILYSIFSQKPPLPPFDVKLIEDSTTKPILEAKIKILEDSLKRSEELFSSYKLESIPKAEEAVPKKAALKKEDDSPSKKPKKKS